MLKFSTLCKAHGAVEGAVGMGAFKFQCKFTGFLK